ncbi:MAG: hypothetical protein QMC83_02890 [Thermodesulfovibrionales bacterium]|nr:hypothetical protein [Thermodesulfovibrionales bacterium]
MYFPIETAELNNSLNLNSGFDSLNRTYGSATAAPLTSVVSPTDYIWELL